MLDRISRPNLLSVAEVDFLVDVVKKQNMATLLRLIYFSDEEDIMKAMDLFASLNEAPRLKAIHYMTNLRNRPMISMERHYA